MVTRQYNKGFVAALRHRMTYGLIQASGTVKGWAREHRDPPLENPHSKLAREVTVIVRDTESELLFNHSSRVYLFGALAGERRGLKFRSGIALCGSHVSRHGFDQGARQRR